MKRATNIIFLSVLVYCLPLNAWAARLVKTGQASTVYYVDNSGARHAYPNQKTYESWHSAQFSIFNSQFSNVEHVDANELAGMKLGENVVMRPGSLIKIPSHPQVYAVEPGGILRPLIGEQTAVDLYGPAWAKRVEDVSEVFFFNYHIGDPVRSRADLPDGTLVELELMDGKYYYKDKGVLISFKDNAAVRENLLDPARAAKIPQIFPIRSRTITGREMSITDPQWSIPLNSADCAAADLKASVLYLSKGNSGAVAEINTWRASTASAWERRTDLLSLVAMNPVEEAVFDDRYLFEGRMDVQEITRTYFDTHADTIDFLVIWNAVLPVSSKELAEFWPVTNMVEGLGKPLFDRAALYGSRGKLKGVINMGRPGDYPLHDPAGMARAVETGLHELLHQWSGEADFRDLTGADRGELQTADTHHWSPFVDFISPVGGWGWQDNGDGSFSSKRSLLAASPLADLRFPDVDLYLMGLVPRHSVAPFQYLKPTNPSDALTATMRGSMQTVTIDEIVYGNGVRRCTAL